MGYIFPSRGSATERRMDPAEEARHREVMDGMGVYDAAWALSKAPEPSDVQPGQNRLLLTKDMVHGGSIPEVFPELAELREDGLNAERKVPVMVLDGEGGEYAVNLRYLNSNKAYRVMGPPWRLFVHASGMSKSDRLDLYTCRRGDGQRCLFAFIAKGAGVGAGGSPRSDGRKRKWSVLTRSIVLPN